MAEVRTTSSTGGQKATKLERFDLIPIGPLTTLAQHYGRGARKYADHQWRKGYEWSKSYSAMQRHLAAFWGGKDLDICSNEPDNCVREEDVEYEPDTCFNHTGSHHLVAAAWHCFTLLEFVERFPQHDDRYKPDEEIVFDRNEVSAASKYFRGPIFEDLFLRAANPDRTFLPDDKDIS